MESRLGYLVLAENVIVDAGTRALTPIKIFDTFIIPKKEPFLLHPSLWIAGRFYIPSSVGESLSATMSIVDPNGSEIQNILLEGSIVADQGVNVAGKFSLLKFENVGEHVVKLNAKIGSAEYDFGSTPFFVLKGN